MSWRTLRITDRRVAPNHRRVNGRGRWYKAELLSRYVFLRQFSPTLLDAFQFRGRRSAASLLQAIDIVRGMNRTDRHALPEKVPTGFIGRVWRPLVLSGKTIDRRAYAACRS